MADIYFSDYFRIDPQEIEEHGALDVSLINDLPLFIDPFLLFNSERRVSEASRGYDQVHALPQGTRAGRTYCPSIGRILVSFSRGTTELAWIQCFRKPWEGIRTRIRRSSPPQLPFCVPRLLRRRPDARKSSGKALSCP